MPPRFSKGSAPSEATRALLGDDYGDDYDDDDDDDVVYASGGGGGGAGRPGGRPPAR